MESEILSRTKGQAASEVEVLNLVKWRSPEVLPEDASRLELFTNLSSLSISSAGLNTVQNFPKLRKLLILELSDNKLAGPLDPLLSCPKLMKLNLAGNRIAQFSVLEPLKYLPDLRSLDLLGNPLTDRDRYRETLFETFPDLDILDGLNREDDEDSLFSDFEDSEEGSEDLEGFIEDDSQEEKRPREDSEDTPEKRHKD